MIVKKKEKVTEYSEPSLCKVEYLQSKAGLGKTYNTLEYATGLIKGLHDSRPKFTSKPKVFGKYVYVGRGVHLCDESRELVDSFYEGGKYKSIYKGSGEDTAATVYDSVSAVLKEEDFDMLFITHNTFLLFLERDEGYMFSGCNIIIDEMLDVFSISSMRVSLKEDNLADYLKPNDSDSTLHLHRAVQFISRMSRDDRVSTQYMTFLRLLEKGYDCYRQGDGDSYVDYTCIHTPDIRGALLHCNRCILMGAKIEDTLSSNLWRSSGVSLVQFTDVTLPLNEYQNEERVTLYYLTHEENRPYGCSRGLLESLYNPSTGEQVTSDKVRKNPKGIESYPNHNYVIEEFMVRTKELLGEDFIYTINRWVSNKGIINEEDEDAVSVPYGCFGWNNLKMFTKAAGLFSYKPRPCQMQAMKEYSDVVGFDVVQKFIEDKHYEPQLQLLGRSAIRDHERSDVKLDWVVVDKNTAQYIVDYHIPKATICDSIALRIPDKRCTNGGLNISDFTKGHRLGKEEAKFINNLLGSKKKSGVIPTEEYLLKRLDHKRRGIRWIEVKN